jgi:hypothetical protein
MIRERTLAHSTVGGQREKAEDSETVPDVLFVLAARRWQPNTQDPYGILQPMPEVPRVWPPCIMRLARAPMATL